MESLAPSYRNEKQLSKRERWSLLWYTKLAPSPDAGNLPLLFMIMKLVCVWYTKQATELIENRFLSIPDATKLIDCFYKPRLYNSFQALHSTLGCIHCDFCKGKLHAVCFERWCGIFKTKLFKNHHHQPEMQQISNNGCSSSGQDCFLVLETIWIWRFATNIWDPALITIICLKIRPVIFFDIFWN